MSKIRLLIKRPGTTNRYVPIMVSERDIIGNCIPALVYYLGIQERDAMGRALTYRLRPISQPYPLSNSVCFADLLSTGTRLELVQDPALVQVSISSAEPPVPSRIVNRRTILIVSLLTGFAVSGLFSGMATAIATRRDPTATGGRQPVTLQPFTAFSGHQQTVRTVSWSPDGNMLASGADDASLLLWTPDGIVRQQLAHPTGVTALAWSPDSQRLVSGSGESVRFFDSRTGQILAPARTAHTAQITSLAWLSTPGYPAVSGSLDTRAIVWETQQYQLRRVFTGHKAGILALSNQRNSTIIASASQGGLTRVWQIDTLKELHSAYQDGQVSLHAIAFSPTGNQLAVGGNDGQVRVWSNGLVCQQATANQCSDVPLRFQAHTAPVRALVWSPDGNSLATGGDDGLLAIWTLGQNASLLTKATHTHPVLAISWSRKLIATASGKVVTIWNVTS